MKDARMVQAKRIQEFFLPTTDELEQTFDKSTVYFRPEDEVGGDFYWYKAASGKLFFVLGDCTGHSMEGAMSTMIVISLLNQFFSYRHMLNPKELVSDVYEQINEFNQTKTKVEGTLQYQLGVEMIFIVFDFAKEELKVISTGLPLWIKRNNQIIKRRYKSVKDWAIWKEKYFDEETIYFKPGEKIITFSDGITDQYNAEDKKKLGGSRLEEWLTEGEVNYDTIHQKLNEWMGDNHQYDDISLCSFMK